MSLIRFLDSVRKHWWTLMSCAAFTLLGIWVLYAQKDNAWALKGTFGLAAFCLFWACFLAWRDEERRANKCEAENTGLIQSNKKLEDRLRELEAVAAVAPVQHIHLPNPPPPPPEPLKHNVQCVGVEIGPDFPIVRMCFRNIEKPGEPVGEFRSARLKVTYTLESSGDEIAEAFPARWNGLDQDEIDIGFTTQCAILAMHFSTGWEALTTIVLPADFGWNYKVEHTPLPSGCLKIVATLIGENNLTLDKPIEGVLTLGEGGIASFVRF